MTFSPLWRHRGSLFAALAVIALLVFDAPAFAQDEGKPVEPGQKENLIIFIIKSAGLFFGPLMLVISIVLVALVVLLSLDLRMSTAIPPGFVDEFTDIVNKRQFKQAFDMARNDSSFLGRVLTSGMARLQYGIDDAREAAANQLESIRSDKDQKNNYTAVIGTLGPLVGLVGTVYGMIESFIVLSIPGTTPYPQELAQGISHALCVTLLGIGVSLPAIVVNTFFRNRITRITMETGHIADDLLTQMYHNSKKGDVGGPSAAPANAPTSRPSVPPSNPTR